MVQSTVGISIGRKVLPARPRNNTRKVRRSVYRVLLRLWKDGMRVFLDVTVNNILVDSGMSAASLLPLAAKVQYRTAILAIIRGKGPSPTRGHGPSSVFPPFEDNIGRFKSIAFGSRLGAKSFSVDFGNPNRPIFSMDFDISVLQHFIHENGLGNARTAQNSLALGVAAAEEFFRREIPLRLQGLALLVATGEDSVFND